MAANDDIDRAVAAGNDIDRAVLGVVFLLVFVFSYSEEIVTGFFDAIGEGEHPAWRAAVLAVDLVLVGAAGLLKRRIAAADAAPPRLWGWWWAGVGIVMAVDAMLLSVGEHVWLDIGASTLFVIAMAMLMLSALNADPLTLFSARRRAASPVDWERARPTVPLIVGTYAAYLGATAWTDYFNVGVMRALEPDVAAELDQMSLAEREGLLSQLCDGAVSAGYFQHVAQVVPLLLMTLGIEFGYFRGTLRQPVQRAATAATVTLLSIALVFALSTLPWSDDECGEILSAWHEYLTFVVTLQAVFTGLVTLVWLLVVNRPDPTGGPPAG